MTAEEHAFEKSFKETSDFLKFRSEGENFSITTIKNELDSLYKYEGLDWVGRGELVNSEIQGSIVAYQVFIKEWVDATDENQTAC